MTVWGKSAAIRGAKGGVAVARRRAEGARLDCVGLGLSPKKTAV